MKKQNSFVKAGATLALSGIAVKVLSAAYRIPLTRMLGAGVMGRYSAVLNLFMPFFSFATAGIVTVVAHFGAKYSSTQQIKKSALRLYLAIAFALSVLFLAFTKFYSQFQDEKLLAAGSIILAPAIMLAAAESVFKGITQAKMNMLPTAQANVLESVFKTVAGLSGVWLVKRFYNGPKDDAAIVVCLAVITASGAICTVFLWVKSRMKLSDICPQKSGSVSPQNITSKQLLQMSLPIGVSALIISASNFFDTAVCLPKIDAIPYTHIVQSFDGASFKGAGDMAMYLFGIWQGMVLTVFNLVPTVISSVGTAGMPLISRTLVHNNKTAFKRYTQKLFLTTSVLSVPAMAFIFCFGSEIIQLLFGTNPAQTVVAQQLLRTLCFSGVFCCFNTAFNAVLYASGRSDTVFRILASACVAKAAASYILCGFPGVNIKAFAVSAAIFYTIIFMCSIAAVRKQGVDFGFVKIFFIPTVTATVSVLFVNWLAKAQLYSLPLFLRLFFSGIIYVLIYLLITVSTGILVDK
ncbi:MAG: oligosaccharide flippase family protein [Oscillospiraceae bacterium]|nr:oligosaccharide flippase family protein [Oscillospiraceae bacterium]